MRSLKYEAVIFDMDGVIFDSEVKVLECWEDTAAIYNIPHIKETAMKCLGINATVTKQIFKSEYGEDFDYDFYKGKMRDLFYERYSGGRLPLKKGIRELLEYLKRLGIKTAVASSTRVMMVEKELKEAGLYDMFDVVIGGDMVEKSKPNPDIFLVAAQKLGVRVERSFVIEDSYNGIRAAYNADIKPIMVPDLVKADEEMKEKSFIILNDLLEVKDFLASNKVFPHLCRCCGDSVISHKNDICDVCEWEDDYVQNSDENYAGGANELSLVMYRKEYNEKRSKTT